MHPSDLDLIRKSRYFDSAWYAIEYPDTKDIDRHQHYLTYGWKEKRRPSLAFNGQRYLEAYPDVARANVNPLVHFLRCGLVEKRWAGIEHELPGLAPRERFQHRPDPQDIKLVQDSGLFDAEWYRLMHGHWLDADMDPLVHYLVVGGTEGLAPSPRFDSAGYARRHPDIGNAHPLLHYLKHGKDEGRTQGLSEAQKKIMASAMASLAPLEPDLMSEARFHARSDDLTVHYSFTRNPLTNTWDRICASLDSRVKYLVAVPWLVRGGADLAAMNVLRALQEQHGKDQVALIVTDHNRLDALDWVPEGSRMVCFTRDDETLLDEQRVKLLETILWTFRPLQIFNVNSATCWRAYVKSGSALSRMSSLRAMLFCRDYSDDQRAVGYSDTHLRPSLPYLDHIYFDTQSFEREVIAQYGLPALFADRMTFLPQPFDIVLAPAKAKVSAGVRPRVLWIGRLCYQKNIELLEKVIASAMHLDFDIYGTGTPEKEQEIRDRCEALGNARFMGSFAKLDELDLAPYTAFLFTSRYEGMPTILLNIAATMLPIVASAVGGVPELIDAETGWAIPDVNDPAPYVSALDQIVQAPALAAQKTQALVHKLRHRHAWDVFKKALFQNQ